MFYIITYPHFSFVSGNESVEYYTNPDFPNSVWAAASITLAILGGFGIISNLAIVFVYVRNKSVRLICFIYK